MAFARLTISQEGFECGRERTLEFVVFGQRGVLFSCVLDERQLAKLWLTRNTKETVMEVLFITIKILPICVNFFNNKLV